MCIRIYTCTHTHTHTYRENTIVLEGLSEGTTEDWKWKEMVRALKILKHYIYV
jgi:hypothetical protein